jgi:filamentous hemagglutinin
MSDMAAAYQEQIAGTSADAYIVDGVRFDGFRGSLLDAKGPGYAKFVSAGAFRPWFRGQQALVNQARRQIAAAGGARVEWHFAEKAAAEAVKRLFESKGISGVDIIHTPPQ